LPSERLSPDIAISIFLDILEAPVCEVMESVASEHIGRGFHVGVLNRRGAHVRRPGGDEERALAETYPHRHFVPPNPSMSCVVGVVQRLQ
jgi:hypothetical protein